VGAAISKAPPAHLPLGGELKRKIIQVLCDDPLKALDSFREAMLPAVKETELSKKVERILPEVVFQILYDIAGDYGLESLRYLERGKPNINHKFLARALADGWMEAVLTTNFDRLIEDALLKTRLKDYIVASSEEDFLHAWLRTSSIKHAEHQSS